VPKVEENMQIFAVQMLFFRCAVKFFGVQENKFRARHERALWRMFCRLMLNF